MDFDLNLLRVLVALDQTRHVGRAAEHLKMSQSGFSSALARLRRQMGDDLFVRTGAGMKPTTQGLELAETARNVLQEVEQKMFGRTSFIPSEAEVAFHVAASDAGEVVFAPPLVRHLAEHAPFASLHIISPTIMPLAETLASGDAEVAIGYFPDLERDRFFRQALYSHTYACIVRKGHPVLSTGMTRNAYKSLSHAVVSTPARSNSLLEKALVRQRIPRHVAFSSPHHLTLASTVANSDLVATVPLGTASDMARSGAVVVTALPFQPPTFTIYQYWHRRTHKGPAFQWLRVQIKTLFNADTDPYR
ncbi:LysR family transcriptional regulator [Polaromonas eurypsychrophila]|uniref:LysR family transcriptional regulator n=1 Tax=Polaromonas eurypsychrophila TaxID=1614635 RepID=A0A916S6A2_9BURK|nr:LysR family transcriptional regulator [Polaromonas eurypsychrophila]GGA86568.1 LysR family transcriptional regulator [Polaromonas eurypsychrophila]